MTSFSMYNPVNSTHRGRVIDQSMQSYQQEQAKLQALAKIDGIVNNLKPGVTAMVGNPSIVDGAIVRIDINNQGSDYNSNATASIVGSTGSNATVQITVSNGKITNIDITNQGSGYISDDAAVSINNGGDGGGAIFIVHVKSGVLESNIDYTIFNPGSNYTYNPYVTIVNPNGEDARAQALINNGEVVRVFITTGGSGYTPPTFFTIAPPDKAPTGIQRQELYDEFFKCFIKNAGPNVDYINSKYFYCYNYPKDSYKTDSLSAITNPMNAGMGYSAASGNRDIGCTRVVQPVGPEIIVPSNPPECYFSIHNTGKLPSEESRYTHKLRVSRNSSQSYTLKKAYEEVDEQVNNIINNGGVGARLEAQTISGGHLAVIGVVEGGLYYTTNPPYVSIRRTRNDPGKAQLQVILKNEEIEEIIVLNPSSNTGYDAAYLPDIIITSNSGKGGVGKANIAGGRIVSVDVISKGRDYNSVPDIEVYRIKGDPGLATAIVSAVDPTTGAITIIDVTNPTTNTGYREDYPPTIIVSGGKGAVTEEQRQAFLDNILQALHRYCPNWQEQSPEIVCTIKAPGSSSMIKRNRSVNIIDLDDPLLRQQRMEYKDSSIVRNKKAMEAALARYNLKFPNGPPAIPPLPEPPTVTVSSTSGGGGIFKALITQTPTGPQSVTGTLSNIDIISGGHNYPIATKVKISGGGIDALGASAKPVITNGSITDYIITYGGIDYTEIPDVEISEGGGTGAIGNAVISPTEFNVEEITIPGGGGGNGYMSVVITGGGGSGAKALALTCNGHITGFDILDGGTGYNLPQPWNPIFLEYLKEAETLPPPSPKYDENILPEPTLQTARDQRGFLDNQSIDNRNQQRRAVRRAASTVIEIAQKCRKEAYDTWNDYVANPIPDNLDIAYKTLVKAMKVTQAAYDLKKWKPPYPDPYFAHKNECFALYRATIPTWNYNTLTPYKYGDLVNYINIIYKVLFNNTPSNQGPEDVVNPIAKLGKWYRLNPISPNYIH